MILCQFVHCASVGISHLLGCGGQAVGLAEIWGRKRVLAIDWLLALPVPFLIIAAPRSGWVVAANVLYGVSPGFARSMALPMQVDLVGPIGRGLAVGLSNSMVYPSLIAAASDASELAW